MSEAVAQVELEHHDAVGARFGMWLFVLTELILFGGLFTLYASYRTYFPADFHFAATQLDLRMGAWNTVILLTSSLTMALAVGARQREAIGPARGWLLLTGALGALFLVNKGFEWSQKIRHGLYPRSTELLDHTNGENMFYGLYYAMTGLHAVHVLVGLGLIVAMWLLMGSSKRRRAAGQPGSPSGGPGQVENTGLYWHFVDIIWIFLFPLFYLIS